MHEFVAAAQHAAQGVDAQGFDDAVERGLDFGVVEHALALLQFAALAGDFFFDFGEFTAGIGFVFFLHGLQFLPCIDHAALGAHEFDVADVAFVIEPFHEVKLGLG